METFVLTFQISLWVEDIFPLSFIENVYQQNKREVALYDNILSHKWGLWITHSTGDAREEQDVVNKNLELNILNKEYVLNEYKLLKQNIIKYGFEEVYENSVYSNIKNKMIKFNYGGIKIPFFKEAEKYYSTGENWDYVKFNENERILAYRNFKLKELIIRPELTEINIKKSGNVWKYEEKQQLFDEYIQCIINTARKHGRTAQAINLMLGEPSNLQKLIQSRI